jgi:hypothetical protein
VTDERRTEEVRSRDEGDTGDSGPPRFLLIVPVVAIIAAVVYLFADNPSAQDAVQRDTTPPATATAPPALATIAPSPAPTVVQRVIPPADAQFRLRDPNERLSPGPIPRWDTSSERWATDGVEWEGVLPRWWQDGPRVHFVDQVGNVFKFHVNGLRRGETLDRDGVEVFFHIAGAVITPRRLRVSAERDQDTGLNMTIEFDRALTGIIAPALTVRITGTLGSTAVAKAPFAHIGPRPQRAYRLDNMIGLLISNRPFNYYFPTALPSASVAQWASFVVGTDARGFGWVVPAEAGWVSLLVVETSDCGEPRAGGLEACFGPDAAGVEVVGRATLDTGTWTLGRGQAQWVMIGRLGETDIMLAAPDEKVVRLAAGSLERFGNDVD